MHYNNKRLALSAFWALLGATLLILSLTEVLEDTLYAGMGGALIAVGLLQILRNLKYRRDPAYREKVDVEANDERGSFLRMKSWSWAGYIVVLVEALGGVAAMILGNTVVQQVLLSSVCLIVFTYWAAYMVLSRKY